MVEIVDLLSVCFEYWMLILDINYCIVLCEKNNNCGIINVDFFNEYMKF